MESKEKKEKKVYVSPNLVEWGTIQDVTKGAGGEGADYVYSTET